MHINLNMPPNTVKKATNMLFTAPATVVTANNLPANKQKFPVLTMDKDSYIVDARVETNLDARWMEGVFNLQVGKHTSIEDQVLFMIDADRDTGAVAQGHISLFDTRVAQKRRKPRRGQILIENDCWIGHGATIMGGVTIHHGAVVAAGAVVTKDVPPYAVVAGNPAEVVKYRFDKDTIRKLLKISWWNWDDDKMLQRAEAFTLPAEEFAAQFYEEAEQDWGSTELYDICKLSPSGIKTYLYFLDCEEIHPLYEKVIRRFVEKFHHFDAELVLYLSSDSSRYDEHMKTVMRVLDQWKEYDCFINICNTPLQREQAIFHAVSCYVTNRSRWNLRRAEYAEKCNVHCIAGVDPDCFEE